jgi:glycogen phosphorylase
MLNTKPETVRIGHSVAAIKQSFLDNLSYVQGRFPPVASRIDYYMALAYTIRDHLMDVWTKTAKTYYEKASRTVCYLSAEFLLGPQLGNNICCLDLEKNCIQAMKELGFSLEELTELEPEPGLGNGGLGRLAACYMDSLSTLNIPAIGYGIRYEFGIFNQEIHHGWQVEITDKWLRYGNPWEIPRPEISFDVKFGGHTEKYFDSQGKFQVRWVPDRVVKSVAYDTPILGYESNAANFLRLWKAEACESFDFQAFNVGDYYGAVQEKISSENITKVLYPNDEPLVGRKLRLEQQYFFVSSALQDMIRIYLQRSNDLSKFHEKYAVQLNDTHPAISIAELMRIFIDECAIPWEEAWEITRKTFCYTNHTLLPEALEKWPLALFAKVLPRHLEIIYEINYRFLEKEVRPKFPQSGDKLRNLSLIDESGERYIRMANLACVGSHAINGVSQLHSNLLKNEVLKDFNELWPTKFFNVTNGITPRRFLLLINPGLANLITEAMGTAWIKNLDELKNLELFIHDKAFQQKWKAVKLENKKRLAALIQQRIGVTVDPNSLFDIQAKRIHEYKRQHLNLLHVITLYNRLRKNPKLTCAPRTVMLAGKAAPGYLQAKLIIKLTTSIAEVVNKDANINNKLKLVFLPNYNVKLAQWVYPAADLSEQISTAGKEASGTGNMKFSLNGAITIGTLDGANIEIREAVGAENFFAFGLSTEEIAKQWSQNYNPQVLINYHEELRETLDLINSGFFSHGDRDLFRPLTDSIRYHDNYMLCADYKSYVECQDKISALFANEEAWIKTSILNVARMGKFSSDRAIREYCEYIWKISPVTIA